VLTGRKIFPRRLSDELAYEVGFWDSNLLNQVLQRGPCSLIEPQHEACAIHRQQRLGARSNAGGAGQ